MQRQTRAYLFAAATIAGWSTVASAFKLSLAHLPFDLLLLWSCLCSLAILAAIAALGRRLRGLGEWRRADWLRSAALGFLNPFLYYLVVLKAYALLPAQEALTLNFIWPVTLVLLSIVVLGQRLRLRTAIAMAVSFSGVAVIATRGDLAGLHISNGPGAALAVGSSVIWALNWLYGAKDRRDPILRLLANFLFGTAFIACWIALGGRFAWPAWPGFAGALWIGAFEMGVTFVMWMQALRLTQTTAQVSNLIYLTPFVSLVVVHFAVGEPIEASTVVGLVLIVGGILYQHRRGAAPATS